MAKKIERVIRSMEDIPKSIWKSVCKSDPVLANIKDIEGLACFIRDNADDYFTTDSEGLYFQTFYWLEVGYYELRATSRAYYNRGEYKPEVMTKEITLIDLKAKSEDDEKKRKEKKLVNALKWTKFLMENRHKDLGNILSDINFPKSLEKYLKND